MSRRNFKGKNILITGASGNLGTALSLAFGRQGGQIIALDLNHQALQKLTQRLEQEGIPVLAQSCDISNSSKLKSVVESAQAALGSIDVLINNAGITHIERLVNIEDPQAVLRRVMEVNLFAATQLSQLLLPNLIEQKGLIINISSVAGFAPLLGRTAYAASKHALHGYFESLRSELHEQGVQCLMVCPSFIAADPEFVDLSKADENSIFQNKKTLGKTISVRQLAAQILKAAEHNRPRLIAGQAGRLSYYLRRFFPNLYERMMRNRLKNEL